MKNLKKSWKTTMLGIVLIISGLAYTLGSVYLKSEIDYKIMSILIASGIALMFSPDTFIDKLNYFIGEKSKNV